MKTNFVKKLALGAVSAFCLAGISGCDAPGSAPAETASQEDAAAEEARFKAFIEAGNEADLARDPTGRTLSKRTGDSAEWTPIDDAFRAETAQLLRARIEELPKAVDREKLSPSGQIQYDIYANAIAGRALEEETRARAYFINGNALNFNILEEPARVLQSGHKITSESDAENYLARLKTLPGELQAGLDLAEARAERGVTMINTAFTPIERGARSLSQGAPCEGEGEHALWKDFTEKLDGVEDISADTKDAMKAQAETVIAEDICPAYTAFADTVAAMGENARTEGLWTVPDGKDAYYDIVEMNLAYRANPAEIHRLGLSEVERLTGEIQSLEAELGLSDNQEEVIAFLSTSEETSLPNTEEGRAAYKALAVSYVEDMEARLPDYFSVPPQRPLIVRMGEIGSQHTVEEINGVKTGIYNLSTPQGERIGLIGLATLSYHEGTPGHHLQQALSEELRDGEDIFPRPFSAAFSEGWALYAERLADEMGVYEDNPYGRLGYLYSMRERAARLVFDTGLNYMEWTIEDAQAYQEEVFGRPGGFNRYLNWPGQALGYYWGYLKWMELREATAERLGDDFDIKGFHTAALRYGSAPFSIIEDVVGHWADSVEADGE